jgi:hypothetical protein
VAAIDSSSSCATFAEKIPKLRAELERLVLATVGDPAQAYELLPMISELLGMGTHDDGESSSVRAEDMSDVSDVWSLSLPELVLALVFVYSARGPPSSPTAAAAAAAAAAGGSSSHPFRQEDEFAVLDRVRSAVTATAAAAVPSSHFEPGAAVPGWEDLLLMWRQRQQHGSPAGRFDRSAEESAKMGKWADLLTEQLHAKLLALSWSRTSCPAWQILVNGTSNKYLPVVGQIARDIADGVASADDAPPQAPATPAGLLRVKPSVAAVAAAGLSGGAAGASGAAASLFKGGLR